MRNSKKPSTCLSPKVPTPKRQIHVFRLTPLVCALVFFAIQAVVDCTCLYGGEPAKEEPRRYKTENVVLVVIDGPRYSETWGDPKKTYIPRMAQELSKVGAVYTNFYNLGTTYTIPGHVALTTGAYEAVKNSGLQSPTNPSVFQYLRKKTGLDREKTWIITSKDKLHILANCTHQDWAGQFTPAQDCGHKVLDTSQGVSAGPRADAETFAAAEKVLKEERPRLLLIQLMEPDISGHACDWEGYLKGIQDSDEFVWQLWQRLQSDTFYKDKTTLFITNDHGRHLDGRLDGFVSHGDQCPGCKHINCFAAGPDFKKGVEIDTEREQIDIPVTIAELMGFDMPTAKGQVMRELFAEKSAKKTDKMDSKTAHSESER